MADAPSMLPILTMNNYRDDYFSYFNNPAYPIKKPDSQQQNLASEEGDEKLMKLVLTSIHTLSLLRSPVVFSYALPKIL